MILSLKCMDNVKINRNLSVNQNVEWINITNEDLERQATSPVSTFFPCVFQVIYNLSMGAPTWDPLHWRLRFPSVFQTSSKRSGKILLKARIQQIVHHLLYRVSDPRHNTIRLNRWLSIRQHERTVSLNSHILDKVVVFLGVSHKLGLVVHALPSPRFFSLPRTSPPATFEPSGSKVTCKILITHIHTQMKIKYRP